MLFQNIQHTTKTILAENYHIDGHEVIKLLRLNQTFTYNLLIWQILLCKVRDITVNML